MSRSRDSIEVRLAADFLKDEVTVGRLFHDAPHGESAFSFKYDEDWLRAPTCFSLDPQLELYAGETYATSENFRIFLDSAPDRWGKMLMDRREVLLSREERRPVRALTEWDYLLGVHDTCRLGALRFRKDSDSPYLDNHDFAAPPVTSLRELEDISLSLEERDAEAMPQYKQWLATLIAPGSSLGGARPKASFTETNGELWIAKFPSKNDRVDIGAWEKLLHGMAHDCGINVPTANAIRLNSEYHTFCSHRFDRADSKRRFFISAMTATEHTDGDGGSYLELAQYLDDRGAPGNIDGDLEQLWRRVAFNVLVGNTDDHMRNHGFIREEGGWRLAPAYDMNPNPAKRTHSLSIDELNHHPDIGLVMDTAEYYRLKRSKAADILKNIREVVGTWRERAKSAGIRRGEIETMSTAFRVNDM